MNSDKPWMNAGTPGIVTVMEGAPPDTPPPAPATPPRREPRSWARFSPGPLSWDWPTDAVLVVWVDVWPDVLAEDGEAVEEEKEEEEEVEVEVDAEVEKEKDWDDEVVDVWSPDNGKHNMFISCVLLNTGTE